MRGFTVLELVVVMGITAVLAAVSVGSLRNIAAELALGQATGVVKGALLAARREAYSGDDGCLLVGDPAGRTLHIVREGASPRSLTLPAGTSFGFPSPPLTTGGSSAGGGDDGVHLDGKGNSRLFLPDSLPSGGRSIGFYLVATARVASDPGKARAVTMSAATGGIKTWRFDPRNGGRWRADE